MAWKVPLASGRYRGAYRDGLGITQYVIGDDGRGFTQAAEAIRQAAIKEVESRNPRAMHPDGGKIHWGDWADLWWSTRKVAASTAKSDKSKLEKHLRPRWGDVPLGKITRTDVQAWVDKLDRTSMSASTIHKVFRILSSSMKAAAIAEPRRIDISPCVSIQLPTIPPADERFLEREEFATLAMVMPDRQAEMICHLLVGTGMRWGELAALHRRRVNLREKRIDVVEAYDGEARAIRAYPKGKKKRSVPITNELGELIRSWCQENPGASKCCTPHLKGSTCSSALVLSSDGAVVDYSHFEQYVWRVAVEVSGVGKVTIHDLRHTYASWIIQNGVRIEVVSELLGHASLSTTQRYAHLSNSQWEHIRQVLSGADPDVEIKRAWVRDALRRLETTRSDQWNDVYKEITGADFVGSASLLLHGPSILDPTQNRALVSVPR